MKISIVVAYSENRVIGKDNKLPWPRIKEDMDHFRKITEGHHVLMGRKTHDSIGRVLERRVNMILTSNPDYQAEGCLVFPAFGNAVTAAERGREKELMVIGGQKVYEMALPHTQKIYATEIREEFDGDTFFPKIDEGQWRETSREAHPEITPPLIYRTLERR